MAKLTGFDYSPGSSFLHQLDLRFKIVMLVLVNLISTRAELWGLSLLSVCLLALIFYIHLPMKSAIKETRYFLPLLVLVFVSRTLSTPGTQLIEVWIISISREGLLGGLKVCWRLFIIVLLGLVFVSTSRTSEIKAAVEWFLKPFPFIPGTRVAVMISLMIRFLPVILGAATETNDAQLSRGVANRKNPVYRLTVFTIPLFRRVFDRADKLIQAMEARCYSENRTDPELSSNSKDWLGLVTVLALCILTLQL